MSPRGTIIVAAHLALLGVVAEVFAVVSKTHSMAVRGSESARDPFTFDKQQQFIDVEIGLGAFVGGYTAGGAFTVAASGRCGCYDSEHLQISHGGQNSIVLSGDGRDQCLHHDGTFGGCGG